MQYDSIPETISGTSEPPYQGHRSESSSLPKRNEENKKSTHCAGCYQSAKEDGGWDVMVVDVQRSNRHLQEYGPKTGEEDG